MGSWVTYWSIGAEALELKLIEGSIFWSSSMGWSKYGENSLRGDWRKREIGRRRRNWRGRWFRLKVQCWETEAGWGDWWCCPISRRVARCWRVCRMRWLLSLTLWLATGEQEFDETGQVVVTFGWRWNEWIDDEGECKGGSDCPIWRERWGRGSGGECRSCLTMKTKILSTTCNKLILNMTAVDKWMLILETENDWRLLLLSWFDRTRCSGRGGSEFDIWTFSCSLASKRSDQ